MKRLVGGFLAVVAAVGAFVLWHGHAGSNPTRASSLIPVGGTLDPGGQELAALLGRGRTGTWHATYAVTSATGQPGEKQTLEVWRSGGRSRQDAIVTSGAQPVHTVGIRAGTRKVACRQTGTEPWHCSPLDAAELDPEQTLSAAIGDFANHVVKPRDATVTGRHGRCFQVFPPGVATSDGEVCVSSTGVPLRIARDGAVIELVALTTKVTDVDFQEPH